MTGIRGAVAGGGMGFVLACNPPVETRDSTFVLAHVKVGLSRDGSSPWHLPRSVGMKKAKQLALLGEMLDAPTALTWRLVNWAVAPDEVHAKTPRIAWQLAAGARRSIAKAQHRLNVAPGNALPEQVMLEVQAMGVCAEVGDFAEGLRRVREKRAASFATTGSTENKT